MTTHSLDSARYPRLHQLLSGTAGQLDRTEDPAQEDPAQGARALAELKQLVRDVVIDELDERGLAWTRRRDGPRG
jgi:hypothetical protein